MTRVAVAATATALVATMAAGCAARATQQRLEIAALSIGVVAGTVDDAERDAYESGAYDDETHTRAALAVERLLLGARAFERAVIVSNTMNALTATRNMRAALDDLDAAVQVPAVSAVAATLRAILNATTGGTQ